MKNRQTLLLLACYTFFFCFHLQNLFSGSEESEIKRAIELKPKNIIRCSRNPQGDSLTPAQALAKASKGDILIIEPGFYEELVINQDSLVISTEGKIPERLSIVLSGKNCILRDFVGDQVRTAQDLTIVNSSVINIYLEEKNEKKNSLTVYNTAIGSIYSSSYDKEWDIFIKNCIIRAKPYNLLRSLSPVPLMMESSLNSAIRISQRCIVEIQNSILYGEPYVFLFSIAGRSIKAKLTLKNCVMFGENGLGFVSSYSNDKNNNLVILEPKDIKKVISSVSLQEENKVEKIDFIGNNNPKDPAYYKIKNPEIKEGIGIIFDENKFFSQSAFQPEERPRRFENHPPPPPRRIDQNNQNNRREEEKDVFE